MDIVGENIAFVANGKEMMRLNADGSITIRGCKVISNMEVYAGLKDWVVANGKTLSEMQLDELPKLSSTLLTKVRDKINEILYDRSKE